ncbi:response regulator transcription factor [Peribacillus kribbensis]|uniref:response regulator transcription factor n=1 Tax=Peribacillus kribbensis TaxID=356658 RepID=UPI0003F9AC13|nr:response regulator transcription factor [Peribacillus kribbensis]
MHMLIIEDDTALLRILTTILEEEGYQTDQSADGRDGLFMARSESYDLLIVDWMLPGLDGISLIREVRNEGINTPVLILTAKDSTEDKVLGLDAGADDYLVKPFATEEFLARVRSILRRSGKSGLEGKITYGRIVLDTNIKQCFIEKHSLKLTKKEYELLHYLLQNREQILMRDQIYDRIWGIESSAGESVVDVYIHYLRKKLAPYSYGDLIRTIRGVGYMLAEE